MLAAHAPAAHLLLWGPAPNWPQTNTSLGDGDACTRGQPVPGRGLPAVTLVPAGALGSPSLGADLEPPKDTKD